MKPYLGALELYLSIKRTAFNWQSDLSDKRKNKIISWIKSLSDDQKLMLSELIDDVTANNSDAENEDL